MRRYEQVRAQIARAMCLLSLSAAAYAQNAPPILPVGDAAVAGFSGTTVIGSPPPPARVDKTYIDLDGPALRVIGLSRMGGPPQAQLVAAPKTFMLTARQIGQVFSLALDDADPRNIYAAATSAYGLPIVVPDADGDGVPDRSRRGAPNAAFMPGLFGPVVADGGPGSIWRIDGRTGAVTLFANVVLNGVANSGPALGGLAFDRASRQLFVADRDTGMIHRFTLDGVDRGYFDHGAQGLAAAGLPPIAFDARKRLNIESPAFDAGNPATWAYAPQARRVFGVAVKSGRLYYAVAAGLRIWSVSILPDGSFGSDARVEVSVPRSAPAGVEISEILFDDNGDMLVAERGEPTGAYDYKALAAAGENRVLRFRQKTPNDPPSRDLWFPVPREYAIGFPPNHRNDNGGIAIGYGYDAAGNINRAVCGGTLWSTGEQLRNAHDPAIIQRLQPGGPLIVDGLQGNAVSLLRPQNEPPFETYFIDYDDRFDDPQTRGHLGDVVIWRVCGQAAIVPLVPVPIVCPVGLINVDGICRAGLACPPGTEFANGCCVYRGCPPSYARIRGRCVPPPMNCGPSALYVNEIGPGRCETPQCPPGLVVVQRKATLGASQTNGNVVLPPPSGGGNGGILPRPPEGGGGCPAGQTRINDVCQPTGGQNMCVNYCGCPEGMRLGEDGRCKPPNDCGPVMVARDGGVCGCPDGTRYIGDGICQPVSGCPEGASRGSDGKCVCTGKALLVNGICCTREIYQANRCGCPEGTTPNRDGTCKPDAARMLCIGPDCPWPPPPTVIIPPGGCPDGKPRNSDGNCPPPQVCTGGKIFDGRSCRCEAGKIESESGQCVPASTPQSKKKKKRRQPPKSSDNPPPQSGSGISIGIGVGVGGGGRGGPSRPVGRPPGGGGGGGKGNPG